MELKLAEYDVFAEIIEQFGEPTHAVTISIEEAARYRGRLPNALIDFWQKHGRGSYLNGTFTICNPDDFQQISRTIFQRDVEFASTEISIIGHNLYGSLSCFVSSTDDVKGKELIYVNFSNMTVLNPDRWREIDGSRSSRPPSSTDFGVGIQLHIGITSEDPFVSEDGEDLGIVARRVIGPLGPGEIYGFFPALALGGEARVENMRRVGVLEHLTFLSQLGPFTLQDLTPPKPGFPYGETISVRQIGRSVP